MLDRKNSFKQYTDTATKEFEMITNILIGLLCYSVFLTLFLVGWHRHQVRMEAYDKAMSAGTRSGAA